MKASQIRSAALVCGVTLALGACGRRDGGDAATDTLSAAGEVVATPAPGTADSALVSTKEGSAGTGAAAGALSGASAMTIVTVANANEIASSRLAQDKATDAEVRSFADDMVKDHRAMQQEVDALAQRLDITPQPAARAEEMKQMGDEMAQRLQHTAKGAAFDRAYVDGQVQAHQATLDELTALQDAVSDEQVGTLVRDAIPKVRAHLERAQRIQGQLGG